jgi:hypothetical protein
MSPYSPTTNFNPSPTFACRDFFLPKHLLEWVKSKRRSIYYFLGKIIKLTTLQKMDFLISYRDGKRTCYCKIGFDPLLKIPFFVEQVVR